MIIKTKSGFSLVEMLVVIALFGIVFTVTTSIVLNVLRDAQRAAIKNEINSNAIRVMESIGREIRNSTCLGYITWVNNGTTIGTLTDCSTFEDIFTYTSTSKNIEDRNGKPLFPDNEGVCGCNGCPGVGFSITPIFPESITKTSPAQVTLSVRPTSTIFGNGQDTCVTLISTFVPRN